MAINIYGSLISADRKKKVQSQAFHIGEVLEMKKFLILLVLAVMVIPAWSQSEGEKEGGGEITNEEPVGGNEGDVTGGDEGDKGGTGDNTDDGDKGGGNNSGGPTGPDLSRAEWVIQNNETMPVVQVYLNPVSSGRAQEAPYLRVFGNGSVRIQERGRSQTLQARIEREMVSKLVEMMAEKGIMEFDEEAALATKSAIDSHRNSAGMTPQQQAAMIYEDDSNTVIEINLESYTPPGSFRGINNFHKRVSWKGLDGDARKYPSIQAIQHLSETVNELIKMASKQK